MAELEETAAAEPLTPDEEELVDWLASVIDPALVGRTPPPLPAIALDDDDEDEEWSPPPRLDDSWRGGSTMSRPHWIERERRRRG